MATHDVRALEPCSDPQPSHAPAADYRAPRLTVLGEIRGSTFGGSIGAFEAGAGTGAFFAGQG